MLSILLTFAPLSSSAFNQILSPENQLTGEVEFKNDVVAQAVSKPFAEDAELKELAQKSSNPLSDVWMLVTQNDVAIFEGDVANDREVLNSLKVQPVMPAPILNGDWNLIFRPVIQFISSPLDSSAGDLVGLNQGEIATDDRLTSIAGDPFGRTNGLGDSVLLTLAGPNRTDGFVWGAGLSLIFPTASDEVLGQGKW